MRIALAASVAALIAIGLFVAGCAGGGVGDDESRVLHSATIDLAAPPVSQASVRAQNGTQQGTVNGQYYYVNPRTLDEEDEATPWSPSMGILDIASPVWVAGSGYVYAGNDAWGFYDRDNASTLTEGLVYFVFLRNETTHTMEDPWIELNSIDLRWTYDLTQTALWTEQKSDSPGGQGNPPVGLCTMAEWSDIAPNSGVPGDTGFDPYSTDPTELAKYDSTTVTECNTDLYEQPLFFKHKGSSFDVDVEKFDAGLTIYWYETVSP